MNPHRLMVVLALAAVACQRGATSGRSESSTDTAAATVAPTPPTASVTRGQESATSDVAPPQPADECTPGQRIDPATLAASWPAKIGARVRFKSRIDVSIDVMSAVVVAAGHRFVVVAGPDQLWQGDKERTFTVMGSKTVALGGRTKLPQLLLEPECPP